MIVDVWNTTLYDARFGDVPLDIQLTQDEVKRSLAKHGAIGRDGALIQNMGLTERVTRARVFFWERDGDPNDRIDSLPHQERFAAFDREHRLGARDFVHPLFGTYRAYVESCTIDASASSPNQIVLDVVFVEDGLDPRSVTSPADPPAGLATVTAAADAANAVLDALELELEVNASGLTSIDDAVARVTTWETDPDVGTEDIDGDMSELSERIAADSDALESEGLEVMPALRAINVLHAAVRAAAAARQRDQPAIVSFLVGTTLPLRVIVSRLYAHEGGDIAAITETIQRINRIDDPMAVPAGTELRRPSTNPRGIGGVTSRR